MMLKTTAAALLILVAAACGNELAGKFDTLADEACACQDRSCIESVDSRLFMLYKEMAVPSADDQKKIKQSIERIRECTERMGQTTRDTLVKRIDELADEACACKDIACAEKVQNKLMDLIKNAQEPSTGQQEKIMKSMERMGECMAKIAVPTKE